MAADAARILVLYAIKDKSLSEGGKVMLYAEVINRESIHASMASVLYWREKYAEAWAVVKMAKLTGGQLPLQFLRQLREKIPEST